MPLEFLPQNVSSNYSIYLKAPNVQELCHNFEEPKQPVVLKGIFATKEQRMGRLWGRNCAKIDEGLPILSPKDPSNPIGCSGGRQNGRWKC
jgi:hypothetical protein